MREYDPAQVESKKADGQYLKNTTKPAYPVNEQAGHCASDSPTVRQSTYRELLEQRYECLLREADQIHMLLRAMPQQMDWRAEEALRRIIQGESRG